MLSLSAPAGLTKRFAILGGVIIVAACLAIGVLERHMAGANLRSMAEHNNVALTRAVANSLWPRYADFLRSAHRLDIEVLRSHPETQRLRRDVLAEMNGLSVIKVKIYDLGGMTVFSTEASQIGASKDNNAGYQAARAGHVVSDMVHRDTFNAFEQVIQDRDVFESYIPIVSAAGEVEAIIEIYSDVTELLQRIEASQFLQVGVVAGTFLVLYLLLIAVVWRSERVSRAQHEENLRLARAAALAEESSRLKSEFLAHMSHELRTPLNAVLGFSETLKGELFGPIGSPKYLEYASDIWASGRHLLSIIDDVLDMSKIEAGQVALDEAAFDPAALPAACVRLVETQAETAGVRVAAEISGSPPWLWADERKIKQIVLNLLSNAVKFTPEGGTVTASIGPTAAGGVRITVADTGIGIAPEHISTVLAPFGRVDGAYAANSDGTGLGLPIAKSFAELHGASFELDSEPGRGTRVRIDFPPERTRAQPTRAELDAAAAGNERRILADRRMNQRRTGT